MTMNELTLSTPAQEMRLATDVAGICKEIVLRTAVTIEGKKYVRVEGWQSIAAAWGCTPEIISITHTTEPVQGVRAEAVLRRDSDGQILSRAFGFVGKDEQRKASDPNYSNEAMAQTRAVSRVCRHKFAFVVVLMDAGLETTPAEEVPREGFKHKTYDAAPPPPPPPSTPALAALSADEAYTPNLPASEPAAQEGETTGTEQLFHGICERTWTSDFNNKKYFFAIINQKYCFTTDSATGREVVGLTKGNTIKPRVTARVEPTGTPNKFYIKSVRPEP
jgi:hypothetical protein